MWARNLSASRRLETCSAICARFAVDEGDPVPAVADAEFFDLGE